MEKYPLPHSQISESTMQRDVVQTWEGRMRRTRVWLTKQSLVDRAVENGVKPFAVLAGLPSLRCAAIWAKTRSSIPISGRHPQGSGPADALYNCVLLPERSEAER